MNVELREAKAWHCGAISRRLRRDYQALVDGVNQHAEMRAVFDSSLSCRKALYIDGQLAAIGGVTGTDISAEAEIWLAVSEEAVRVNPITVTRLFKRELDKVLETRRRLVTVVLKNDRRGMMLAYFLGFRVCETREINGREAAVMEIERAT